MGFLDSSDKPVFMEIKTGPHAGFTYNQKINYSNILLERSPIQVYGKNANQLSGTYKPTIITAIVR